MRGLAGWVDAPTLAIRSFAFSGEIPLMSVQKGGESFLSLPFSGTGVATMGLLVMPRADLMSSLSLARSSLSSIFPP